MMSAPSSLLDALRVLVTGVRRDVADLARNAPAARFIGEQVVRQAAGRLCVAPASRAVDAVTGATTRSAAPEEQVTSVAPLPDYDVLSAREIVEILADAGPVLRAAITAYEARGRGRRTVLEAASSHAGS
jgi:hypothetical protein